MRTMPFIVCLFIGALLGCWLTAMVEKNNPSSPYKEIEWVMAALAIGTPSLIAKVVSDKRDE